MSETDLVRTAGEILTNSSEGSGMMAAIETIGKAGGLVAKESGRIVLGVLVQRGLGKFFNEYKRKQREGDIPDDYETTEHGAKLLQESLNAISNGLDEDQADAVRKVFLGLASNPPEDSMERIQQLSIIETTASLSPWEIATLNLLERISKELYSPDAAEIAKKFIVGSGETKKKEWDAEAGILHIKLNEFTNDQADYKLAVNNALASLVEKKIIASPSLGILNARLGLLVYQREHFLTNFGCKLATHLYSVDFQGS